MVATEPHCLLPVHDVGVIPTEMIALLLACTNAPPSKAEPTDSVLAAQDDTDSVTDSLANHLESYAFSDGYTDKFNPYGIPYRITYQLVPD